MIFGKKQAKLTASDAAIGDRFGSSVSVSENTVVVGSYRDDDDGNSSGSAYVFARIGGVWTQQAKLTSSDAAELDQFGWSVSISSDTIVVGSRLDDDDASNAGSAYVFVHDRQYMEPTSQADRQRRSGGWLIWPVGINLR